MSKYGFAYRGEFDNVEMLPDGLPNEQIIIVTLWDTTNVIADDDEQSIFLLDMAGVPVVTSVIDNDEDKFTQIRAKQAKIIIHTTDAIGFETFADSEDRRWLVQLDINEVNKTFFKGFLNVNDIQELFQPDPNELLLTAYDNLGTLKDIPLTDFTGANPTGKNRIADYLTWCLSKTGLELDLFAVMNIREEDHTTEHFYDVIFLDALTFEKEIGESEDCYTVLQKILGEDCFITQWKGNWWIMRVDEFDVQEIFAGRFDETGAFVNFIAGTTYNKSIGEDLDIDYINEGNLLKGSGKHKFIKETYKFEFPLEIICNVDFSRGDFIADLPDEIIDSITYSVKSFDPECWTYYKGWPNVTQDSEGYIKVLYNGNDYEKERYLFMPVSLSNAFYHFKSDNLIDLGLSDKFGFSVDFKHSTDLGGGSGHTILQQAQIRLYGSDGTYWTLYAAGGSGTADASIYWLECTSTFTTNQRFIQWEGEAQNTDFTEWQSVSIEAAPVPVSGKIEILLLNNQTPNSQSKSFQSLSFDYIPYINGSYRRYSGQYHKIEQVTNSTAVRDKQVYISDSPRPIFKGALFKFNGTDYVLTGNFYNAAVFPTPPAAEFMHPFGELQAFSVWNQYNRVMRIFMPTLQGLHTDKLDSAGWVDVPDILHKYILTDLNPNSSNKYFQLLTHEQDYHLCEWKGTLVEVYDTTIPKVYTDTHEFKYVST